MHAIRSSLGGLAVLAATAVVAGACDGITSGPDATDPTVRIRFATPTPTAASPASSNVAGPLSSHGADAMTVEGTNGTLVLTDVRLIVAEFELDRVNGDCDGDVGDGDDPGDDDDGCEEFEGPPAFIDLPLSGGSAMAVEQPLPSGEYEELEFKVEDLDLDDDDEDEPGQRIAELRDSILADFPDWPDEASVVVTGEFTPTGGTATAFRAYFESKIEIEREFEPPLAVAEDEAGPTVTVHVDPAFWFRSPDGTVHDLTDYDYEATGEVYEFKVEFDDGVTELEWEDD